MSATKLHVGLVTTPGEARDANAYPMLMHEAASETKALLAKRDCDADAIGSGAEGRGNTSQIPTKCNLGSVKLSLDGLTDALRDWFEGAIARLNSCRFANYAAPATTWGTLPM